MTKKCDGVHNGSSFTDAQLKESVRQGSTYAERILRSRHPEFFRTVSAEDAEVRDDADRIVKFYKQLLATGREEFTI